MGLINPEDPVEYGAVGRISGRIGGLNEVQIDEAVPRYRLEAVLRLVWRSTYKTVLESCRASVDHLQPMGIHRNTIQVRL
jgi:hypothetical protein